MRYEEEISARALYDDFVQDLATPESDIGISIQGQGVHWTVALTRAQRSCIISCFQKSKYHIAFKYQNKASAMGRTSSKQEIMETTNQWLRGKSVRELYEHFTFVDRHERALEAIEQEIVQTVPDLRPYASIKEHYIGSEFNELWFTAKDRSCHFTFYGENDLPDAFFYWDDCQLFQVQTGQFTTLAFVLKRWLHDYIMPSTLEKEFPWIEVGKIAQYYEQGRGIEGEFVVSWDAIEEFYQDLHYPFVPEVLSFITQIREHGYDRLLRAGQSLWTLIVSRSRRHGLRFDRASISFNFHRDGMDIEDRFDENVHKISNHEIAFTTEIEHLLKQLAAKDID